MCKSADALQSTDYCRRWKYMMLLRNIETEHRGALGAGETVAMAMNNYLPSVDFQAFTPFLVRLIKDDLRDRNMGELFFDSFFRGICFFLFEAFFSLLHLNQGLNGNCETISTYHTDNEESETSVQIRTKSLVRV